MTMRFCSSSNWSHRCVSGNGMSLKFRFSCGMALLACPRSYWQVGGDQRLAAVGQKEHELQAGGHADLAQDLQRLSVEGVVRTRDGDAFGKVLMMGSVSCVPSTTSRKIC